MYLLRMHADRDEYQLIRCADLRREALDVLALEAGRLCGTGGVADFAPGLPVSELERAWNEAADAWGTAVAPDCRNVRSTSSFQVFYRDVAGKHGTLDGVCSDDTASTVLHRIAAKLGLSEEAASRVRLLKEGKLLEPSALCLLAKHDTVHVVSGLEGGAPTEPRPCLVCRHLVCKHLVQTHLVRLVCGTWKRSFCSARCARLFAPWIVELEEVGGVHDGRFFSPPWRRRYNYAAMEATLEEAMFEVRRELRAIRVFRGVVQASRALLWLHRRVRARRVVQSAVVHHLYRPGGRAHRRLVAQWRVWHAGEDCVANATAAESPRKRQRCATQGGGATLGRLPALRGGGDAALDGKRAPCRGGALYATPHFCNRCFEYTSSEVYEDVFRGLADDCFGVCCREHGEQEAGDGSALCWRCVLELYDEHLDEHGSCSYCTAKLAAVTAEARAVASRHDGEVREYSSGASRVTSPRRGYDLRARSPPARPRRVAVRAAHVAQHGRHVVYVPLELPGRIRDGVATRLLARLRRELVCGAPSAAQLAQFEQACRVKPINGGRLLVDVDPGSRRSCLQWIAALLAERADRPDDPLQQLMRGVASSGTLALLGAQYIVPKISPYCPRVREQAVHTDVPQQQLMATFALHLRGESLHTLLDLTGFGAPMTPTSASAFAFDSGVKHAGRGRPAPTPPPHEPTYLIERVFVMLVDAQLPPRRWPRPVHAPVGRSLL